MSTDLVFFLHRLGIKVYRVKPNNTVVELVDIGSLDESVIINKLKEFSGSTIRVLTSDTISYLFQAHIDISQFPLSRDRVMEKIRSEIPENIESIKWDYKLITKSESVAEVVVFSPVAEFQKLIISISKQLHLVVEAIEPESVATSRHPNPIVGITLKEDIGEKDEATLNITAVENISPKPFIPKILLIIFGFILFIFINYILYQKYQSTVGDNSSSVAPTPTVSSNTSTVISSSPTPIPLKKFLDLELLVQNGTTKAGLAGSIAAKFKENGVTNVTTGNADRDDYTSSILIFTSDELKKAHLSKFNDIFPVNSANVQVDKAQSVDAILILGIN